MNINEIGTLEQTGHVEHEQLNEALLVDFRCTHERQEAVHHTTGLPSNNTVVCALLAAHRTEYVQEKEREEGGSLFVSQSLQ